MPDGMTNVDATVLKLAKQYHDCNVRSSEINDERKVIRENAEKLGIDPGAFQVGVRMAQAMTVGERQDFTGSLTRVLAALDGQESDLFGQAEIDARNKRAEKRAAKSAPPAASTDGNPRSDPKKGGAGGADGKGKAKDAAPKGKRGKGATGDAGATGEGGTGDGGSTGSTGPADGEGATGEVAGGQGEDDGPREGESTDAFIASKARELNAAAEQREGAATLSRVENLGDNGKPKSQSQLSAEALERAKMDGRLN